MKVSINDARRAREHAEAEIQKILAAFEVEVGCKVSRLVVERVDVTDMAGPPQTAFSGVKMEVLL